MASIRSMPEMASPVGGATKPFFNRKVLQMLLRCDVICKGTLESISSIRPVGCVRVKKEGNEGIEVFEVNPGLVARRKY